MTSAAFSGAAAIALIASQAGGGEVLRTQPAQSLLAESLRTSPDQTCPAGFQVNTATDRRFACWQRTEAALATQIARLASTVSCANSAYWNVGPVVQVVQRPGTHSDIFWICKHG